MIRACNLVSFLSYDAGPFLITLEIYVNDVSVPEYNTLSVVRPDLEHYTNYFVVVLQLQNNVWTLIYKDRFIILKILISFTASLHPADVAGPL